MFRSSRVLSSHWFVVQLPFCEDVGNLGESHNQALKRFQALENRLDRNAEMKKIYSDFINEYLDLGHAKLLNEDEIKVDGAYYLPQHCVLQPDSSSTKLRVEFVEFVVALIVQSQLLKLCCDGDRRSMLSLHRHETNV